MKYGLLRRRSPLVTPLYDRSICSNGFRVFNVNRELIDPYFLLFALASCEVRQQVFRLRTGAAIPSISDVDLLSVIVPRFSATEESQIANVVRSGFESRIGYRREVSDFRSRNN